MQDEISHFTLITEDLKIFCDNTLEECIKQNVDTSEFPILREFKTLHEFGFTGRRPKNHPNGLDGIRLKRDGMILGEVKSLSIQNKQRAIKIRIDDLNVERVEKYPVFLIVDVYDKDKPSSLFYIIGNMQKLMLSEMKRRNAIIKYKDLKEKDIKFSINQLISMGFNVFRGDLTNKESFNILNKMINKKNREKISNWTYIPQDKEVDFDVYYKCRSDS